MSSWLLFKIQGGYHGIIEILYHEHLSNKFIINIVISQSHTIVMIKCNNLLNFVNKLHNIYNKIMDNIKIIHGIIIMGIDNTVSQ